MKSPNITRRDFAAAVVGAVVLSLAFILLGLGPWRYTVATFSEADGAWGAYVVDTWTGRPRLWIATHEEETRSIAEQFAELVEQIKREARRGTDENGKQYYLCELSGYPPEVVRVYPEDLRKFVRAEPLARPAKK
jgi:hypothetical protein